MPITHQISSVAARYPSGVHVRRFLAAAKAIVALEAMTIDSFSIVGTQRNGILLTGTIDFIFSGNIPSGRITQIDAIPANLPASTLRDSLTISELKANQYSLPEGHIAYANDVARSGGGVGCIVYFDGLGTWRRIRDDAVV